MNLMLEFSEAIERHPLPTAPVDPIEIQRLMRENEILREEIRVSREAAEITASLVVKQFEETERILRRFQDANAQRKAVLDSAAQIAIIATDIHGIITVFNTGAENLLGYRASEVIGAATPVVFHIESELRSRCDALAQDHSKKIKAFELFFKCARKEKSDQQEWTYVRKDGTQFPVTLTINELRDPEGEASGILFIAIDITEKKRSEKALKESERNYRMLIDNIPNIVYKGYADGSIYFFDDKIETLTGYSKEVFNSCEKNWFDIIVEEDRERIKTKFLEALRGNKSYIREYRILKKTGETVWIEACGQIVCDENGQIDFVTGAFLNITERKVAEQALHESEEKYRSLFHSGPNPIFVLDRKSLEILDANPSAEEAYQYSRQELVGRCFEDLGTFEYESGSFSLRDENNTADACIISPKMRHYRKDGKPLYAELKACPATYRNRPAIILAATDVTDTIEKDAQIFQASKMTTLGEMSAGIAHELNQPLNAIKIGNDYLKTTLQQGKTPKPDELLHVTKVVSEQVERASDIINRLREFGHKSDFKKEMVCVNTMVEDVLKIIAQQLVLQNIEIQYELAEDLPLILANRNRLEQVVFNLVTNARDAIEQSSIDGAPQGLRRITLATFVQGDIVGLSVSDTGVGIPEGFKDKIFEPFYTTKEVGKGMGLGLSITYGIVRDFGGNILVESKPDQGTCFKLRFPKSA